MNAHHLKIVDPRHSLFARIRAQSGTGVQSAAPESGNELPELDPGGLLIHPPHLRPLTSIATTEGDPHYLVDLDPLPDGVAAPSPRPSPPTPWGNHLYDNLRTRENSWRWLTDYVFQGSYSTPAAGTSFSTRLTTTQAVVSPFPVRLRLCEYPYTMQAILVVRYFAASPRTLSDTGNVTWTYISLGGANVVLNIGDGGSAVNDDTNKMSNAPITDATPPDFGALQISTSPGGVFAATWDWAIGFSVAYLRPGSLVRDH